MFYNYFTEEQQDYLLHISKELALNNNKTTTIERDYFFKFFEENIKDRNTNNAFKQRVENVFITRRDRFFALFQLSMFIYDKGTFHQEDDNFLSWLGSRFGFNSKEIAKLSLIATQASLVKDNLQTLID